MIKILHTSSTGYFVNHWQTFLRGQGYAINVDGIFGDETENATREFQRKNKLDIDGVVGNQTLGKAAMLGFEIVDYSLQEKSYPSRPDFPPIVSTAARQNLFGPLEFRPDPTSSNKERIKITNDFESKNIITIPIPQLIGVKDAREGGVMRFHKLAENQLKALWKAWADAGLIDLILTFDGDYVPRFVRGKAAEQVLSNHAFGTAFDINAKWNAYGAEPATESTQGCVYPLVKIAAQHGFFWGGHFSKKDGMHFEIAKLL